MQLLGPSHEHRINLPEQLALPSPPDVVACLPDAAHE